MLYECDDGNCSAGRERCTNRAFADLQERRLAGGPYRIGVEVVKTADRGYGVRSNRGFEPNQIIVEYTGEIITEQECERRMNEDYKNNEVGVLLPFYMVNLRQFCPELTRAWHSATISCHSTRT